MVVVVGFEVEVGSWKLELRLRDVMHFWAENPGWRFGAEDCR